MRSRVSPSSSFNIFFYFLLKSSEAAEDDRGQLALHVLALTLSCQRPVDAKGRDLALMLRDRPSRDGKRNRFSEAIQLLALCALGDRGRSLEDAALKNIVFLVQKSTGKATLQLRNFCWWRRCREILR